MPEIDIGTISGENKGVAHLPEEIFAIVPNEVAVYEVCRSTLANRRRGTASTKGRAEVRGGGAKPYRQKGTGRARQGTKSSPILVGGGVTFGPKPRDFGWKLPKKVRQLALFSALSEKCADRKIRVIEDFKFSEPKTKKLVGVLKNFNLESEPTLIVLSKYDRNIFLSGRNIPWLQLTDAWKLDCYTVLKNKFIVFTESALNSMKKIFV